MPLKTTAEKGKLEVTGISRKKSKNNFELSANFSSKDVRVLLLFYAGVIEEEETAKIQGRG